jgi:1,2-diacylglycerol 3-beta-galactosyltransferase
MQKSVAVKKLELVFFDAGGGHRSAANALCEMARREERPWQMNLMNLQELLDEMDIFRKITGVRLQDLYNLMLRKGWTIGSPALMKGMHGVIRVFHSKQVRMLTEYWQHKEAKDERPELVVSLIPNFNRALYDSMQRSLPDVPLVTILTDMADYPPHFWIERQKQFFICGTEKAWNQAIELGHSPDRLFRTSGMILNPRFYEPVEVDRERDRVALGLDSERSTAMMMFGGEGSAMMLEIARRLDASGLDVQIIAVCGKSTKLEAAMRAMPRRIAMHVVGFTREVPKLMRLSDFFIGKPGPGSISEAVAMGLPVIIERNHWTLPQERYNADWVEEQKVGISLNSFRKQVVDAVGRMSDPVQRCEFVRHVGRQRNRAVFEIPQILERILAK